MLHSEWLFIIVLLAQFIFFITVVSICKLGCKLYKKYFTVNYYQSDLLKNQCIVKRG